MAFASIIGFKNKVTGIQRASHFDVRVFFNKQNVNFNVDTFRFTCKSASIPSSTFGMIEVPFMGRKIKFAGDRNYQDWNTTVIVDTDWTSYKNIYEWHTRMNGPQTNTASSKYMNDFKGSALVTAYAQDGTEAFNMTLLGFFPYDLQQLDMAWDSTDQTLDLNVTWAYDYALMGDHHNMNG